MRIDAAEPCSFHDWVDDGFRLSWTILEPLAWMDSPLLTSRRFTTAPVSIRPDAGSTLWWEPPFQE